MRDAIAVAAVGTSVAGAVGAVGVDGERPSGACAVAAERAAVADDASYALCCCCPVAIRNCSTWTGKIWTCRCPANQRCHVAVAFRFRL